MKAIFIVCLTLMLSIESSSQTWLLVQKPTFTSSNHFKVSLQQTGNSSFLLNNDVKQRNAYSFSLGTTRLSHEPIRQSLLPGSTSLAYMPSEPGHDRVVAGKVLIGLGVPITLLGIAGAIGYAIDGETAPLIVMCVATPIGVGILIGGIVCVVSGKNATAQEIQINGSTKYVTSKQAKYTISCGLTRTTPGIGINIAF